MNLKASMLNLNSLGWLWGWVMAVGSMLHLKVEDKGQKKKRVTLQRSVADQRGWNCSLPSLDDGVFRGVVWNVIRGGAAGLHEELGVVDRCCGLDLHVDPAPYVILQRVWARILHDLKLTVGVELKAVGEGAEAFLHHCDVVSVDIEGQGHVLAFGVLAEELDFQQMLPGDHVSQIVYCGDFIKKVQVVRILLKRKQIQDQPPQWSKWHERPPPPFPQVIPASPWSQCRRRLGGCWRWRGCCWR